jgi:hypothetical protein
MLNRYDLIQIEKNGLRCKFHSMCAERDGWIMPDGWGVAYAGYSQLCFEPESITTANEKALRIARQSVATQHFKRTDFGDYISLAEGWTVDGDEFARICYSGEGESRCQLEFRMSFKKNTTEMTTQRIFNISQALAEDDDMWEPSYSPWRHGGWYVHNVQHLNGGCGCVSNNYPDEKWRIACDGRRDKLGEPGDFTFSSRDEAAKAERALIREQLKVRLAAKGKPTSVAYYPQTARRRPAA